MKYVPLIILTVILTVAVWITQMSAIADGLVVWTGMPIFMTYIVAFIFGWIPPFAPVIATIAAVDVWGWNWLGAITVFFGIYVLYVVLFVLGLLSAYEGFKWARHRWRTSRANAARFNAPDDGPTVIDQ